MARQLGRHMLRRRRVTREVGEHRASLLDATVGISVADHRLRAGLVGAPQKDKLAAVIRVRHGRQDGPAGQDLGEIGDVGLGVDSAHAERVQFKDFAREVFVETFVTIDAGNRVGADGLLIVQIKQHRRMTFHRKQHVAEAAQHMRADRFALVTAGHDRGVGVDAEMVRPEPHQALDQAELGVDRSIEPRLGLFAKQLSRQRHRLGLSGGGRCRIGLCLHGGFAGRIRHRDLRGDLAANALALTVRGALGVVFENCAIGRTAARQVRIRDLSCAG